MEVDVKLAYSKIQPIVEVYACLQSEGKWTGIPHILIRTTGCVLRCQFSETDFCDSWYTSWSPDKGKWSLNDIIAFYKKHKNIRHTMITGGSPTMHPELLKELSIITGAFGHKVTLETEGSFYVENEFDLISLSPKFQNSLPKIGTVSPTGRLVNQNDVKKHHSRRQQYNEMRKLLDNAYDYQLKPVISSMEDLEELILLQEQLDVPNNMCWLMPAGGTIEELEKHRVWLMEFCWQNGYNYTDRIHIIAYNDKRGV